MPQDIEALMKYVTISNRVNKIATAHRSSCSSIGSESVAQSASSERRAFDDGFDAVVFAKRERPDNFLCCGHCLKGWTISPP
jgi:hypothetical protein